MDYKKECLKFKEMRACTSASKSMVGDEALDGNNYEDERRDVDDDYGGIIKPMKLDNVCLSSQKILQFSAEHPGRDFSCLKKLVYKVIPRLATPVDILCRIEELELGNSSPSKNTIKGENCI